MAFTSLFHTSRRIFDGDPFGHAIDAVGETAWGRENFSSNASGKPKNVRDSNAIFLSMGEGTDGTGIESHSGTSILSVSEIVGFLQAVGMIGFVSAEGKVPFEITVVAARQPKLEISWEVLKLAEKVKDDRKEGQFFAAYRRQPRCCSTAPGRSTS